jgi:hypothetical protein
MNHQEECREHEGNHFDLLSPSISSYEVNPRIPVPEDRVSTLVLRQRLLDPPPRQAVLPSSARDSYREAAVDYGIHNLGRWGIGHPSTVKADGELIQQRSFRCG